MTRVRLQVTRNLIDWALQQNNAQCALSLAIKDQEYNHPRVTQKTISFTDPETRTRYTWPTPPKVAEWIDQFDHDRTQSRPIVVVLFTEEAATRPVNRHKERLGPRHKDVFEHELAQRKVREARAKVQPAKPAVSNTQRPLRSE